MKLSADDRKFLKGLITEGDKCLVRIDEEREALKDIAERAKDEVGIDKKIFNKLVRTYHKHNFSEESQTYSTFEYLYEAVIEGTSTNDND